MSSNTGPSAGSTEDPYSYHEGFGNFFTSEVEKFKGRAVPKDQSNPQKWNFHAEQLNGTSFVSPRETLQHVWFYRKTPSASHGPIQKVEESEKGKCRVEASFLATNDKVEYIPRELCWNPFIIPAAGNNNKNENSQKLKDKMPEIGVKGDVDFVDGIATICGNGDPTMKEGVAVHIYVASKDMDNRAFCNNDGDMLILPQQGRLDIQTEMGKMMVKPGELAVIQAGIRFTVKITKNKEGEKRARGYIQELFGTRYELPELGPIGSNGLALPRHFKFPMAHYDGDEKPKKWRIDTKLAGKFWYYDQESTPFDVAGWHGNYIPYKYAYNGFVPSGVIDRDQSDPSVYTVIRANSKIPGVPMTELYIFPPRWVASRDSMRIPYYHRNMATEIIGVIEGEYPGSSRDVVAGGLSVQPSYMPHGETYEAYYNHTQEPTVAPVEIKDQNKFFMLHISTHCAITKFAEGKTVRQPLKGNRGTPSTYLGFHREEAAAFEQEMEKQKKQRK